MALAIGGAAPCASFKYVSPGCSWYEQHMLGGCERPKPQSTCSRPVQNNEREKNQRLAILIPFRGEANMESFAELCARLPAHLDAQETEFHLLAVNQADGHPFNRAALANAAVSVLAGAGRRAGLRVGDRRPFDCLAIHDVDRFPVSSLINSSCAPLAAHYYRCSSPTPHVLHPESYTGGVLLLRPTLYRAVNGFSNDFWGWGHEDNEFYLRLRSCGLPPQHLEGLDWCMEHRDCTQCQRAKPAAGGLPALRAETRSIALLQERLHRIRTYAPHVAEDGISTLNFSTAPRPTSLACGGHKLHVLDVHLHRPMADRPTPCLADGSRADDGCTAQVASGQISVDLLERARAGLPSGFRRARVLSSTRSRAMYNYHHELDFEEAEITNRGWVIYRVAVCEQAWQKAGTPAAVRYQLLWRAVSRGKEHRFRFSKAFDEYRGRFPCALREPPWERAAAAVDGT